MPDENAPAQRLTALLRQQDAEIIAYRDDVERNKHRSNDQEREFLIAWAKTLGASDEEAEQILKDHPNVS